MQVGYNIVVISGSTRGRHLMGSSTGSRGHSLTLLMKWVGARIDMSGWKKSKQNYLFSNLSLKFTKIKLARLQTHHSKLYESINKTYRTNLLF